MKFPNTCSACFGAVLLRSGQAVCQVSVPLCKINERGGCRMDVRRRPLWPMC